MDINLTLIVQMLVFATFVWFTMKFVWPPLSKALEERQNKIADGLAAAERGRKEFELAELRAVEKIKQAQVQASKIIEEAYKRQIQIIEEAKQDAKLAAEREFHMAQDQLQQEINQARSSLKTEVAQLAMAGAEALLGKNVDESTNSKLLDNLIKEIEDV